MSAPHRIRQQRWQVRSASAGDAFAVRSALRRENELSLLPALESAFAELDDGERDIHLPRLEIRVSVSSLERLAEELPEKLLAATRLALAAALDVQPGQRVMVRDLSSGVRLRRYIGSGQVDWFDAERDGAEVASQLAAEAALWTEAPAAAWHTLLADLPLAGLARVAAFFRFLQLLDDVGRATWADFAERLAVALGGAVAEVLAALRRLQAGRPSDHALRLQALGLLLVSGNPAVASWRRSEWIEAVHACAGQLAPLSAVDGESWRKFESVAGALLVQAPAGADPAVPSSAAVDPQKRPILPVDRDSAPGLTVHAAGLVLLHPYLPRLFSALGWIAGEHRFGDPFPSANLPRAAAMLHWLATGRDEPFEFEQGMAKLLLGKAPDDPLPVAAGLLGAVEREEGAALLAAVVDNWPALGKTSVDGLRLSFLQRGGLLYPASDGWLLRLQAESFDLLLDRLPWGISIVRLPWMRGTLFTEWTPA